MGSKTYDGVRFSAYTNDHPPPHVHGGYAELVVLVELLISERSVRVADRTDPIQPANAKRSQVKHVLRVAQENFDELVKLWEAAR